MARLSTLQRRRRRKQMKRKGAKELMRLYVADEEQTICMTPLERRDYALSMGIYLTERVASLTPKDRKNRLKLERRQYAKFLAEHGEAVERARRERGEALRAMLEAGRSNRRSVVVIVQQAPPDFLLKRAARQGHVRPAA